ncbi:protoporphyrinogen oxidase [Calliphora vicina]|uniref:protoporphyrinogen oxidase n=1 Tax=Calliphora vicina TaxID=7373 RepID=UPI00325B8472
MPIVLGGGISGLSAGYYLLKKFGQPTAIFEASNRVGGWIRTEKHKEKGFIFEAGPRTIRPKGIPGANTLELIEDLQVPIEGIKSSHAAAKNRMIYAKGKLCMLPNSLGGAMKTIPPFSQPLMMAVWNDLMAGAKKIKYGDESIYDFVHRRFGSEIADYAISPMICGICAGDAKEISVRFLMNDLFETEQKYGGVVKGMLMSTMNKSKKDMKGLGLFAEKEPNLYTEAKKEKWSMYGVEDGLETLPRRMNEYLKDHNVEVNLSSECKDMIFSSNGARLNIKDQEIETEHVISSIPSYKLAACLKNQHPGLAGQLLAIPYADVAVVNLQYNTNDLLKQSAFGFLVPPLERRPILGVIFDSCCFDMQENTVLTVMMGGKWFEHYFGRNPTQKELLDIALNELQHILGIHQEPKTTRVHILKKCIPQYNVGHRQRVEDIRRYIQRYKLPLSLCGSAYDGVGINDVILSARKSVYELPSI